MTRDILTTKITKATKVRIFVIMNFVLFASFVVKIGARVCDVCGSAVEMLKSFR